MNSITESLPFEPDPLPVEADAGAFPAAKYMNPYLAGVGLGLVLLASFVIMGRGLGASGAFTSIIAWMLNAVAPVHAAGNAFFREYLGEGVAAPLNGWLVWETLGVVAGGFLSGALARRVRTGIDRGPRITRRTRLVAAFIGASFMGF